MQQHISIIELADRLNRLAILELTPDVVSKLKKCSDDLQAELAQVEPNN